MNQIAETKTNLAEQVKRRQDRDFISDSEFAKKLGIDITYLRKFYEGDRNPGRKLLAGLSREYPELGPWISLYLQGSIEATSPKVP